MLWEIALRSLQALRHKECSDINDLREIILDAWNNHSCHICCGLHGQGLKIDGAGIL